MFFLYRLFRDVSGELLDAVNDLTIDLKGAWDIIRDLEAFARDDLDVLWILLDVGALEEGWEEEKGSKLSFAEDGGKGKHSGVTLLLWGNIHASAIVAAVHGAADIDFLKVNLFAVINFDCGVSWGESFEEKTDGDLTIVDFLTFLLLFLGDDAALTINAVSDAVDEAVFLAFDLNDRKFLEIWVEKVIWLIGLVAFFDVVKEVVSGSAWVEIEVAWEILDINAVDEVVESAISA